MKHALLLSALVSLTGCASLNALPDEAPTPVKASAVVIDAAATLRAWELLGYIK